VPADLRRTTMPSAVALRTWLDRLKANRFDDSALQLHMCKPLKIGRANAVAVSTDGLVAAADW